MAEKIPTPAQGKDLRGGGGKIICVQGHWHGDDPQVWWHTWYKNPGNPTQFGNCDCIVPYGESGQMALVTWFAIWKNGKVIARVDARGLEARYEEPQTSGDA